MTCARGLARLVLLGATLTSACAPDPAETRIYRYTDERGHVVFVSGERRVPARYRKAARPIGGEPGRGDEADVTDEHTVLRYPGPGGRPAFTNRRDLVPAKARAAVQVVDLSHVSTNPELGRDLDAALDRELERLAASRPCKEARAHVRLGRWALLWRDQRHLVVVGLILAALLLTAPWAVRRLGAPWVRVLAFAIPALLLTGLLTHGLIEVNRALSAGAELSRLCGPAPQPAVAAGTPAPAPAPAPTPIAASPEPAADLRGRVEHVDQLRAAIEAALAAQDARIQEELSH